MFEILTAWHAFFDNACGGVMLYGPIMAHAWMTGRHFKLYDPSDGSLEFPWPTGHVDFQEHLRLAASKIQEILRDWNLWQAPRYSVEGRAVPNAPTGSREEWQRCQNRSMLSEQVSTNTVGSLHGGVPVLPSGFIPYVALERIQEIPWEWVPDNPSDLTYMFDGQHQGFFMQGKGEFLYVACRSCGYKVKLCCFRGCFFH